MINIFLLAIVIEVGVCSESNQFRVEFFSMYTINGNFSLTVSYHQCTARN